METKKIILYVREYEHIDELNSDDHSLLLRARQSTGNAYAPYSGFKVGAAVALANGETVCGANQENVAYPSGLCAERVAMFAAGATYPGVPVTAIAVTAVNKDGLMPEITAPCGACRQVMQETESRSLQKLRVILDGHPIIVLEGVDSLLPFRAHIEKPVECYFFTHKF